jgi:predicted MPP superfamily phosphohydrolase
MAYSIERCIEITNRVDEVGIHDTSIEFNISKETVKRAMRYLKQNIRENEVIDEVEHHKLNGDHRVLCIGDLHAPFDLEEYYDFCCDIADKYKPTKVVFIGDVIDNHYASYHETDPPGS